MIAALVRETVNKLGSKKKKKTHIKVNIVVSAVGVTAAAYRQLLADECGTYLDMSVMKDLAEEMILSQILRGERSQSCKGQGERCPGGRDSRKMGNVLAFWKN